MNVPTTEFIERDGLSQSLFAAPDTPLLKVMELLDSNSMQIVLVVDSQGRLLGTITDGDIRRLILAGKPLEESIAGDAMNTSPVTVARDVPGMVAGRIMSRNHIHCIPVVDDNGTVVGMHMLQALAPHVSSVRHDTHVVLMVGGLGKRLRPYTENVPKPMLPLAGKPILEHIIGRFVDSGFRRFWLAVNYKADIIEKHFGDGTAFGCEISYVREEKPLGTGGALSLLPVQRLSEQIIVMNGDLLTDVNFAAFVDFHRRAGADATMGVCRHTVDIPFGVVRTRGIYLEELEEKPSFSLFVNAGIYVLNRDVLPLVPRNEFFDLPELFLKLRRDGGKVAVFPLHESWTDIGTREVYENFRE